MVINEFNWDYSGLKMPEVCPVCGADLEILENGEVRCTNELCSQKVAHKINTFFDVMDIKGAGPAYYEAAAKDCKNLNDFLAGIESGDEASIKWAGGVNGIKVRKAIKNTLSNPISISKYLALFDLEGFGVRKFSLLEGTKLFKSFIDNPENWLDSFYEGNKPLPEVVKGMKDDQKNELYKKLIRSKVDIDNCRKYFTFASSSIIEKKEGNLSGLSFCFTGAMAYKRADLEKMVTDNGGEVKGVSKGLSFLVQADPSSTSSKSEKAKQLGTKIISPEEFLSMIK